MTVTDLDQQLAELRSAARTYAARHEFIEDLTWPEGIRTCDFDAMLLRRLLNEPPGQLAKGEFGSRPQRVALDREHALLLGHSFADDRRCELPDIVGVVERRCDVRSSCSPVRA